MDTEFTPDELDLLSKVLEEYLSDLRSEIRDTDMFTFRDALRKKEQQLKQIVEKVEVALLNVAQ